MDLMHHEDRTLGWISAAIFVALVAGALFISWRGDPAQWSGVRDEVRVPPIAQPTGF